ncbi:hypothetical protein C9374_011548 [Naegleria lovaniensis]|uniref:Uncharacterized protein n=1 Tax=Naegleria lovaniensis TaxID=51637 RepID=A0AA88GXG8_NAELO|nr:uncharacterized protein C9374_011548 [Naegleria lovaniensis]KAG2392823.1 hypothetical protein C9374_011548 [Naegleria lovaniensis]
MSKGLETGCEVMKPIPNMSNEDWKEHHLPKRMRLEIANVPRHKGAKKLVRNFAIIVGSVYGYVQRVPSQNPKYTSVLIIACSSRSQIRLRQFLKFLMFSWIGECMLVNQFHEFNKGQSDVHSKTFSIKATPHNLRISNSRDEKKKSGRRNDEIKHNTTVQSFDKSWASVVNYFDFVEALERSESESYSTNSEDLPESSREF